MAGPSIGEVETKLVNDALVNGWYGDDAYSYVEKFEREFAEHHNRKYGLMTPNCTTALHLLMAGLGIGVGDEVIAPECTWIGSVAGITYLGATTVFADIDNDHWCLTPESIDKVITKKTRAVIVVNLYGNMPDYSAIEELCRKRGLYLIEDAAESLGSEYCGRRSGGFGVGSVFSFHRTKTITTGEGGMLLIDDQGLYERCKFLRDHGRRPGEYFNTEVTFKYMPSNIQAALGYAQFRRMHELVDRKRWIWKEYKKLLNGIPGIVINPEPKNVINGVWCTALILDKNVKLARDDLIKKMGEIGVPTRPFFYPLSSLPAFPGREAEGRINNPTAYSISSRGINLPCSLNLDQGQIEYIARGVIAALQE